MPRFFISPRPIVAEAVGRTPEYVHHQGSRPLREGARRGADLADYGSEHGAVVSRVSEWAVDIVASRDVIDHGILLARW